MKTPQSPLAQLDKPGQRRKLNRDMRTFQRHGGQIQQLASSTARNLCPASFSEFQLLRGYPCEL